MLSGAARRMDVAAQNIANITTPGYKAAVRFERYSDHLDSGFSVDNPGSGVDWSQGRVIRTGNDLDLAITGDGYFVVRSGDEMSYTRNGQFQRDEAGRLTLADGSVLQTDGGDALVPKGEMEIATDGTIRAEGRALARIAVVRFDDRGALRAIGGGRYAGEAAAAQPVSAPQLLQGALEQSNASDATEMLALMASLRSAETGQHIVQLYDDLLAQAANGFGQGQG